METTVAPGTENRETWGPSALWVGLVTFAIYVIGAWGRHTGWTAHSALAFAILNGSFSLAEPFGTHEVIHDPQGHHYIAYGPTPALFLMPFVAIVGRNMNQTVVSAIFGAVAVALWWQFLGNVNVAKTSRRWLTALFALGTPFFFYASQDGGNWAITHSVGVLCIMATLFFISAGRTAWAGFFFGLAVLSRNPVLLTVPVYLVMLMGKDVQTWRALKFDWRPLAIFIAGFAMSTSLGAYYNWERFGSPSANGYHEILLTDPIANFGKKPTFALEYAKHNLQLYLLQPPLRFDKFPWYGPDIGGMSMFFVTPLLLLLPWANWRRPVNLVALACIAAVQALYWLFIGDGRGQFGVRYAIDYLPLVLLLVVSITANRFGRWAIALTCIGVAVEIWGFVTFHAMGW